MWHIRSTVLTPGSVIRYQVLEGKQTLRFDEVIRYWQSSPAFCRFFGNTLAELPFEGFFWEVKPIQLQDLPVPFEYVVVKSDTLTRMGVDPRAFREYFTGGEPVTHFTNLGGDAELVAPTPIRSDSTYSHLGIFLREAPTHQIEALWRKVGQVFEQSLSEQYPRWLSTSGLGVAWLHIRIDLQPKYYTYGPYRSYLQY